MPFQFEKGVLNWRFPPRMPRAGSCELWRTLLWDRLQNQSKLIHNFKTQYNPFQKQTTTTLCNGPISRFNPHQAINQDQNPSLFETFGRLENTSSDVLLIVKVTGSASLVVPIAVILESSESSLVCIGLIDLHILF